MKRSLFTILLATILFLAACGVSAPPLANTQTPVEPTLEAPAEATPEATTAPVAEPTTETAAGKQAGETTSPGTLDQAALDAVLNQWLTPGNGLCDAPGAVLLVDSPSGRYLKAAGVASLEDERPMAVDDHLEIGSNTKAFTVALALQLEENGVLSMDDPLSQWLPELAARIPNGDQVTLRQMAGNTSGIADYADPLMQPLVDNDDQEGLAKAYTPEELVDFAIANGTPDFAPGEGWHYSSTNFILLGMAVEAATGQSLAELYQERIFDPLGMENTSYLVHSPEPGSGVEGYYTIPSGELVNMTNWNATQGGAAGAIVSTAEDMARFASGLFGGELFQHDATLKEMLTFRELTYDEGSGIFAGYGLGLISFGTQGFDAYGHAGQTPGFQSIWFHLPEADTNFIFLTNSGSCRVTFLPISLTPEMFGLQSVAQEPSFCANFELPFPRPEPDYNAKRLRDLSPFADALATLTEDRRAELDELLADATILDMQQAMESGDLTAEELVTYYVDRIQRYDVDKLNSVMELNPQALEIAHQLDAERVAGTVRGDMHGIPVLLKDNIATGDGMHTSAGAYALKDWQPDRDAFLVQQLRDAGAVILGKANLSEWANWMDFCMPNGFSALGGQTRNPYGPFETYGSSSGSAVAAAANLVAATVGTETQGSIVMPAQINSVVAIKTSMGLVSRDYVIPLLEWQDVPGPMGRTVTDVAVLLTAMSGVDGNDPVTQDAAELAGVDFTQFLAPEAAAGLRVGIVVYTDEDIEKMVGGTNIGEDVVESLRQNFRSSNDAQRQIGQALGELGFEVVEVNALALPSGIDVSAVLPNGFKDAINRFLAGLSDQVAVGSLEEIIALNAEDLANRAPYGQGNLEESQNAPLTEEEYLAAKEENQGKARGSLSSLFADHDIDVLISDVGQAYAPAGFPAMTLPIGYGPDGMPLGLTMVADYLGEPKLIAVGYALEQSAQARRAPDLEATMEQIEAMGNEAAASGKSEAGATKPQYATDLEAAYGEPSQAGFGSAVFYEPIGADDSLEQAALAKYKYFVGELWERWGEEAWMGPWKEVYVRETGAKPDIVAELRGIDDPDAALSVPMVLDNVENAEGARGALAAAYNDPAVTELRVYNLGDGEAMSGLLVAGYREAIGEATFLVFLLD